jgi:hypothetical protein
MTSHSWIMFPNAICGLKAHPARGFLVAGPVGHAATLQTLVASAKNPFPCRQRAFGLSVRHSIPDVALCEVRHGAEHTQIERSLEAFSSNY